MAFIRAAEGALRPESHDPPCACSIVFARGVRGAVRRAWGRRARLQALCRECHENTTSEGEGRGAR